VIRVVTANNCPDLRGKHPIGYLGCKDYPIPYGPGEKYVIPQKEDVIAAVKKVLD
jgi:pyruvate/2-oxoglutarate/acetoin dehydrogenase E1 component